MLCFNHQNTQAIALCAGCLKSVCSECRCEIESITSCQSDLCKERIFNNCKINERAEKIYGIGKGKKGLPIQGLFLFLLGILFAISDIILYYHHKYFTYLGILGGCLFIFAGLYQLLRKDRLNY